MQLGKCPKCHDGAIEVHKKIALGKKVELYRCSNAKFVTEDGELWERAKDESCDFEIWQNALARYGKWLKRQEVEKLLENGAIEVELVSKKYGKKISYTKKAVLDLEYGIRIDWES